MKMYTNSDQTAKLIELGFREPKSEVKAEQAGDCAWYNPAYSIGELLSFCTEVISNKEFDHATINIFHDTINWVVGYEDAYGVMRFITSDIELIDALCTLCRKLKAEGVI